MNHNDILDLIANWFINYASENVQRVAIDTDGIARINGEFDLNELVEIIEEEVA